MCVWLSGFLNNTTIILLLSLCIPKKKYPVRKLSVWPKTYHIYIYIYQAQATSNKEKKQTKFNLTKEKDRQENLIDIYYTIWK